MPGIARIALAASALAAAVHGAVPAAQHPLGKPKPLLVDSQKLQDLVSIDNLSKRADELYQIAKLSEPDFNRPTRVIGSKGHEGTLKYIIDTLHSLGKYYNVSTQTFPIVTSTVFESQLVVGDSVYTDAKPFSRTPATKDREPVHGPLVLVAHNGCEAGDYPTAAADGIVLVQRGECAFGHKSELAGRAGAKAAIIYNTDDEDVSGTLGDPEPHQVATLGLTHTRGAALADRLRDGERIDAIAYVDAAVETIHTRNVVAQTVGGDPDNCVVLGGHSDSVDAGPGINDDGSGSLALLEVAVQLSGFAVRNCVRFAWWSAEEEGLVGSTFYATSLSPAENQKVRVFVDLDMLASPNYAYQVYNATNAANPEGSEQLRDLAVDWYTSQGLNHTFSEFDGRSDYVGFIDNGIPAGGWSTGAEGIKTEAEVALFGGVAGEWYDKNYHQIGDDVSNLNLEAWQVNTKLIAHTVATYARSFEGFPKRKQVASTAAENGAASRFKYRGPFVLV
ncbi:aminopeptidase Y precursor [Cordyceps fumosorosea ARSEF 2679]|uniref:Peptide hydrolase n=1 Tax=Cordyceps fumosorosea (strain ARSEF 2679) TaxID=1081104 RepID=A0A167MIC4_CORFA|nr:aminopeptidase Y precursor [Cordyceps fumosorosea ARSEF 2679]OAA54393.1 aminopeptidase Y precursor [Cordyceps fumosorosea ARSEF 2679]